MKKRLMGFWTIVVLKTDGKVGEILYRLINTSCQGFFFFLKHPSTPSQFTSQKVFKK